jgi:hypothetical protein
MSDLAKTEMALLMESRMTMETIRTLVAWLRALPQPIDKDWLADAIERGDYLQRSSRVR